MGMGMRDAAPRALARKHRLDAAPGPPAASTYRSAQVRPHPLAGVNRFFLFLFCSR